MIAGPAAEALDDGHEQQPARQRVERDLGQEHRIGVDARHAIDAADKQGVKRGA